MSPLIASTSFCMAGLSLPTPMISNACTIGMPAVSIVASWRAKIAMSSAVTLPSLLKSWLSLRTFVGRYALPAQVGTHLELALREAATLDPVALAVLAFPMERKLLVC